MKQYGNNSRCQAQENSGLITNRQQQAEQGQGLQDNGQYQQRTDQILQLMARAFIPEWNDWGQCQVQQAKKRQVKASGCCR